MGRKKPIKVVRKEGGRLPAATFFR